MDLIITYLTFSGNCREAMNFYHGCLGGELHIQSLGEAPESAKFPKHLKNFVLQASLKKDHLQLMGSDLTDDGLLLGNTVSILLDCADEGQLMEYFSRLEKGAVAIRPLKETHWGNLFGGLTDRYGHHWLFHCGRYRDHGVVK